MMVLRAFTTLGLLVTIFMPSAAGNEQLGTRLAWPSISTTQMRQAPEGSMPSIWQSVGTWMPSRRSTFSRVSPAWASTDFPFTVSFMVVIL